MNSSLRVRSTAKNVNHIEVNKDTVYVRSNIKYIEEEEFRGWVYDEVQYSLREYIENLIPLAEAESMALLLSVIMSEMDFLRSRVESLEEGEDK